MKRQSRRRKRRPVNFIVIMLVCCFMVLGYFSHFLTKIGTAQSRSNLDYMIDDEVPINSSNAILISLPSGEALLEKKATTKIYPASMTKIMTAIIALENLDDTSENIVLREEMYSGIRQANAMTAGFEPGEEVPAIDLLYGLLLPSGAECAIGLAEHVAGSESAFVDLMNKKAQELGMNATHFTNTTGLHDKEHYSTVSDIATLLTYALKNKTFYQIFTSAQHSTPATNRHSNGIAFYSSLFSKLDSTNINGGIILGGKTGYTSKAGQCLASLFEKDGHLFILVTSGAQRDDNSESLHIDDALMVYGQITLSSSSLLTK